jgi:hypothetical protein
MPQDAMNTRSRRRLRLAANAIRGGEHGAKARSHHGDCRNRCPQFRRARAKAFTGLASDAEGALCEALYNDLMKLAGAEDLARHKTAPHQIAPGLADRAHRRGQAGVAQTRQGTRQALHLHPFRLGARQHRENLDVVRGACEDEGASIDGMDRPLDQRDRSHGRGLSKQALRPQTSEHHRA